MERAIVIGSPGAGKSTFARRLRDASRIPLYYLDMIWHLPDRTNVSREEFDMQLQEILAKDRWIIDGNYLRTMEARIAACDTIFLLDYPVELCLEGVEERIGKPRTDMPWWKRSLMKNSGSGFWISRKSSFRKYMNCWKSTAAGERKL